jgi:outer membrane protein assembly complex protein YaeT
MGYSVITMLRRILLLALLIGLETPCAHAQGGARWTRGPAQRPSNWRIQAGLVPEATLERLKQRYPWIEDADELEDLLRDIGRRHATTRLEAYEVGGVWVLRGARAPLIADIEIDMVSRVLRTPLYAAVQGYLGQVDSTELRGKIDETIKSFLRRRGYPLAQVTSREATGEEGLELQYQVREGDPCVISRIEMGFQLPKTVKLGLIPGDLCDRDTIHEKVTRLEEELRDLGYNQLKVDLQELAFDPESNTATVFLSGVLGQRVRYEIIDQSKAFLIGDILSDEELTRVDPTIVGPDAMAAELARRYRNKGYLDVEVAGPEVRKAGDDEFVYVYNVTPGREYKLRSVKFEGATVFEEDELLETMDLQQVFSFDVDRSPPFNPEEIGNGIGRLRAKYQQAGYWDAKIRDPGGGQRDRETGTVRMTIQIEEGLRRILADVTIQGNAALPTSELRALFQTKAGEPIDRAKLVDFQQAVRTAYLNKGYLYAEVDMELSTVEQRKTITTSIIVKVKEGPRVRVGDISITGLIRTNPKVVRRELGFEPGDWYEPEKITQSRQALTRLGIFRSVQILPADRNAVESHAAELDLVVDVREAKAGNVSFGPGWSLRKGWSYGAEASYSNIGGTGRQVSMRGSMSEERHQKAIGSKTLVGRRIGTGYTEPWIFDLPIDMQIKASQEAEWGGELWELSYGGEVALQHKLRSLLPDATVSVFYGQEVARTEGPPEKENELVADDVRIGSTGFRFNIDRRDNLKFPTGGFTFDSEIAWARYALGGDLQYFRWNVSPAAYFGLLDDLTLALGLNLTSYEDIERKSGIGVLPPTERRKVGLGDQVRGYRAGTLGPIVISPEYGTVPDASSPTGKRCNVGEDRSQLDGNRRSVIKTELRKKLSEDLAVTGFIDNGNVFLTRAQANRFAGAYAVPVAPPTKIPECAAQEPVARRVEDNVGYDYAELLAKPGYVWSYHYWSYGAALSLLTPVGAINVAYGLPWREPETEACAQDSARCYPRAKQDGYWLFRGELHINVGARF